jgi:predicted O-methyltransferase YrrM
MFHDMPAEMVAEMERLQAIDTQDRVDGTPHLQRLRQIPPETGKFLALLLANAPAGKIIEIGTSVGYSTLWLALACVTTGRTITTFEVLPEKVKLARATFATAGVEDVVTLIHDDARQHLADYKDVAFCFLEYGCGRVVCGRQCHQSRAGAATGDQSSPGRRAGGCHGGAGGQGVVAGAEGVRG